MCQLKILCFAQRDEIEMQGLKNSIPNGEKQKKKS